MISVAGNTIRQKKFGGLNSKRRIENAGYDKQSQNAGFKPETLNFKSEILNENECSVVSDSHPHSDKQHRNEDATRIREY